MAYVGRRRRYQSMLSVPLSAMHYARSVRRLGASWPAYRYGLDCPSDRVMAADIEARVKAETLVARAQRRVWRLLAYTTMKQHTRVGFRPGDAEYEAIVGVADEDEAIYGEYQKPC